MTAQELADFLMRDPERTIGQEEASAMLRQQAEQIEALKADAERFVTLSECVISSDLTNDIGVADSVDEMRAAIDAMKGAT